MLPDRTPKFWSGRCDEVARLGLVAREMRKSQLQAAILGEYHERTRTSIAQPERKAITPRRHAPSIRRRASTTPRRKGRTRTGRAGAEPVRFRAVLVRGRLLRDVLYAT